MTALQPAGAKLPAGDPAEVNANASVPILVVDDNAAKRLALKAVLAPLGYSIVEADSGLAALRCVMAQDFAVILLDVRMPIMDGFETAALIRQRAQSEMTPIIFITAHGSDEVKNTDLYAEGAVDFIFAPVPPRELRAKVSVFANLFLKAESLAARAKDVLKSATQLRLLTDAAPIGIFQTDGDGKYVYTNPRWSTITGIQAAEALGREWAKLIGSDERAGLFAELPRSDDPPRADTAERIQQYEIRVPGSPPRIVLATSTAIPERSGESAGWIGTLADITAEVGAEAAMSDARDKATEASRLKSDFLANMSHEIRTPMNGVIGMTDLLLETDLDASQRDYAQTVRSSGEALLTIIDDILDFSKVEAGKLEVEDVPFDVHTIVNGVVDLLARPSLTKGIELTAVVDDSVPAHVLGDPGRVRQILINLIGNAIKFTHAGTIRVRVMQDVSGTCDGLLGADTALRFEVIDTGVGIPADKLGSIFQPFVQADTSTSRKYGGTGLGLSISSHLVALMGGTCGVASRADEGSTFWFTICVRADTAPAIGGSPVPIPSPAAGAPVAAPPSTPEPVTTRRGRLLLAEDNLINQKVAVAMLSGAGYRVDTVLNGAAAVKAVAETRYDAILMDCQMPELNGYGATAAIRAYEGTDRHTPIIALTAGARDEDRARCLAEGMDGYLAKPVNKAALLAVVARSFKEPSRTGASPDASVAATAAIALDPAAAIQSRADAAAPGEADQAFEPPEALPALDAEVVDRLITLDEQTGEDFMEQLIPMFTAEADIRVTELQDALAAGDAECLTRVAHNLRGASANVGAAGLARLCAVLEATGLEDGEATLESIALEVGRVRAALEARMPAQ